MANILEIAKSLEQVPDGALQQMTQRPDSAAPAYLVVSEINRRNKLRQGSSLNTGAAPTVADQVTSQIQAQTPYPTAPQGGVQKMAGGGIVAFREGGIVKQARIMGYTGVDDEVAASEWIRAQQMQEARANPLWEDTQAAMVSGSIPMKTGFEAGSGVRNFLNPFRVVSDSPVAVRTPTPLNTPAVAAPTVALPAVTPPVTQEAQPVIQPSGVGALLTSKRAAPVGYSAATMPTSVDLTKQEVVTAEEFMKRQAALMGEDEVSKELAAQRAKQEASLVEDRRKAGWMALMRGGIDTMIAGGQPGATFLGAVGEGAKGGVGALMQSQKEMSDAEKTMQAAKMADLSRQRAERAGAAQAGIGAETQSKQANVAIDNQAKALGIEMQKFNAMQQNELRRFTAQMSMERQKMDAALARGDKEDAANLVRAQGDMLKVLQSELADMRKSGTEPGEIAAKQMQMEAVQQTQRQMISDMKKKLSL